MVSVFIGASVSDCFAPLRLCAFALNLNCVDKAEIDLAASWCFNSPP
jgi:hypothetical protein